MEQYLIQLAEDKASRVVATWSWLIPPTTRLPATTVFGDLFLADGSDHVAWLNTLEGTVTQVASSIEEWRARARRPEIEEEWFWPGFLESLRRYGTPLGAGQCYGWTIHPLIGGPLEVSNLAPIDIVAYHTFVSTLHRTPPGTVIRGFTIDGAEPGT